jgi:hypothetical protein
MVTRKPLLMHQIACTRTVLRFPFGARPGASEKRQQLKIVRERDRGAPDMIDAPQILSKHAAWDFLRH